MIVFKYGDELRYIYKNDNYSSYENDTQISISANDMLNSNVVNKEKKIMDYLDFIIAVDNAKEVIYQIDSFIRILKESFDKDACNRESIISFWEEERKILCRDFGASIEGTINSKYSYNCPDVVRYIIAGLSKFYDKNGNAYNVYDLKKFYDDLVGGRFD